MFRYRILPMLSLWACVVFLCTSTMADAANAVVWKMDTGKSTLSFKGKQMGSAFSGQFKNFVAEIVFDPEHLPQSHVKVTVDTSSADTGDKERDTNIASAEWFDVKNHPVATFEAQKFSQTDDKTFVAEGDLNILGISVPLALPFTLDIEKSADGTQTAHVLATVVLDRSKWQLGKSDWKDPSIIANDVTIDIDLTATAGH